MATKVEDGRRVGLSGYRQGAAVLAGAVLAAVLVARLLDPWTPLGDHALMRMWVESVGGRHTPLIGPDSHYGWNHLGPWLFYLLALPYHVVGGPTGLLLGAALINLGAAGVAVAAARAAGGARAAVVTAVGVSCYLAFTGSARLLDPWNPTVVLVPLAAAVLACWATLLGRVLWVPVVLALGALCIQAHITYAPPAAVLVGLALVMLARAVRNREPGAARAVRLSAFVTVAAWLPLVLDLGPWGTNDLGRVARFMRGGPRRNGIVAGLRATLRETGLQARWFGSREPVSAVTHGFTGRLGLLPGAGIVVLLVAAAIARRRRDDPVWRLCVLLLGLLAFAPLAVGALVGPLYPYLFEWVAVVGMLSWLAAVVLVARLWAPSRSHTRVAAHLVCASVLVVAAATLRGPLPRTPRESNGDDRRVLRLVQQATSHLERGREYRTLVGADRYNALFEDGFVSELARRGYRLRVSPDLTFLYGTALTSSTAKTDPVLMAVVPYRGPMPAADVIAYDDPLSAADRERERQLTARVSAAYRAAGRVYAAAVVEVGDDDMLLQGPSLAPGAVTASDLRALLALRRAGPPIAIVLRPPIPAVTSDAAFRTWLNTTPAGASAPRG